MPKTAGRDVMVGTFAVLALIAIALAIMTVGGDRHLRRGAGFTIHFPQTDGLRSGSPVKMSGVVVGSVREIVLPTDLNTAGIEVRLTIDRAYAPRVRDDAGASLKYLQLLSGEKYVEISQGTPGHATLPEGSVIPTSDEKELLDQGADIAGNINEITLSLRNILGPIEKGEGLLGQLVRDPEFGKEGLASMKASLENLEVITGTLRNGKGVVGRLLSDAEFARRIDGISKSLEELAATVDQAAKGKGALGALLTEGGSGQQAIEDLRLASASFRRVGERLESRTGLIGRLLYDEEYSEALASDLKLTLRNVQEVTTKINAGQGTLGALVNERVLYDSMEDIIAGTNDSKFARWLLRHYQKKGIEAPDAVQPAPATAPPPDSNR